MELFENMMFKNQLFLLVNAGIVKISGKDSKGDIVLVVEHPALFGRLIVKEPKWKLELTKIYFEQKAKKNKPETEPEVKPEIEPKPEEKTEPEEKKEGANNETIPEGEKTDC